jgi:murein DD-endopeptidase MepM/ murein hydrolase activator NlpD
MSEELQKKQSLWERLQHNYRLVIMNNETFEEMGSYRLSLLNVYIFLSTLIVLVTLLVISIIVFTPAKRLIPGYADIAAQPELIEINRQLDSMSQIIQAQKVYTDNFRRMLTGDVETINDVADDRYEATDSSLRVDRIAEDELLRQEIQMEEVREITQATQVSTSPVSIPLEQIYFTPPLKGELSAGFMPEKRHFGVDVLAPRNTPIKSALDGWVIQSDWTLETGNTIGIQHDNNIITFYKHNSVLLKKVGSYVKAGEAVAIIGNTGEMTDGPHLHFELWYRGNPVDPADYINFN